MTKPIVLLVDDEQRILNALRRTLRRQGYQLLFAGSGEEAKYILKHQSIDIILTDYRMPNMNGEELLIWIRETYPQVRRMMLTGFSSIHDAENVLERGATERLLRKPWEDDELCTAIRELLIEIISNGD